MHEVFVGVPFGKVAVDFYVIPFKNCGAYRCQGFFGMHAMNPSTDTGIVLRIQLWSWRQYGMETGFKTYMVRLVGGGASFHNGILIGPTGLGSSHMAARRDGQNDEGPAEWREQVCHGPTCMRQF